MSDPPLVSLLAAALLVVQPPLVDPSHETTTADVPGLDASSSKCAAADRPMYGFATDDPVRVGGGAAYGPSREVRYLNSLRGPAGQGLHLKRRGTGMGTGGTILDIYEITYAGLDKPLTLYVDEEHWTPDPKSPKGLLCGVAINLMPPGPDPFERQLQMRELGVELASADVPPIPLDADGTAARGVVFDYVRLVSRAARAAAADGHPLNARSLPRDLSLTHLVVVAYPVTCEGKSIAPESVALSDPNGNAPRVLDRATGADIKRLVAGLDPPPSAIAVSYATPQLIPNAKTTIRYAESACADQREAVLPIRADPPRVTRTVLGVVPPGVAAGVNARVQVQVYVGLDGKPRFPAYLSGPPELIDSALKAASEHEIAAARINGVPIVTLQTVTVSFVYP